MQFKPGDRVRYVAVDGGTVGGEVLASAEPTNPEPILWSIRLDLSGEVVFGYSSALEPETRPLG